VHLLHHARLTYEANISPSGGNNDSIRGGIVHLLHHARLTYEANISPSGGNNDSIRGGIVHLLHHARLTYEDGEDCEGMELEVMHFIFSEMRIAMPDRNIPPYAPYIMRLILDKGIE
jgi:hypothetical protein